MRCEIRNTHFGQNYDIYFLEDAFDGTRIIHLIEPDTKDSFGLWRSEPLEAGEDPEPTFRLSKEMGLALARALRTEVPPDLDEAMYAIYKKEQERVDRLLGWMLTR